MDMYTHKLIMYVENNVCAQTLVQPYAKAFCTCVSKYNLKVHALQEHMSA